MFRPLQGRTHNAQHQNLPNQARHEVVSSTTRDETRGRGYRTPGHSEGPFPGTFGAASWTRFFPGVWRRQGGSRFVRLESLTYVAQRFLGTDREQFPGFRAIKAHVVAKSHDRQTAGSGDPHRTLAGRRRGLETRAERLPAPPPSFGCSVVP